MTEMKTSYTSADSIPIKVLLDKNLIETMQNDKKIIPIHLQYLPTNNCNLACKVCSCSERDRKDEISLEDSIKIIKNFKDLGTKAVTITGGGEPLMHPDIEKIIDCFYDNNIKIGLVSNGLRLKYVSNETLDKLTWCRISNTDDRVFNEDYKNNLSSKILKSPTVDWAFSHVASKEPNYKEIKKLVTFANEHNFTHVRIVSDLFEPNEVNLDKIKFYLNMTGKIDDKVIYQGRKEFSKGSDCYIAYLKPLVAPNKKLYMCCGVQYALKDNQKGFPEELSFGHVDNVKEIYNDQKILTNGNSCIKCYYKNYNDILKAIKGNIEHKEFV